MPGDTTRLHIYSPDFTDIDVNHVELVLRENDFAISEESYETTIISRSFPDDEESLSEVEEVEEELREWFGGYDINRSKSYSDQIVGSGSVSYVIDIYMERE